MADAFLFHGQTLKVHRYSTLSQYAKKKVSSKKSPLPTGGGFGVKSKELAPKEVVRKSLPLDRPCPCHSGETYGTCCEPRHSGSVPAPTAEALLRGRYSAFSLALADYIMDTTHASHPDHMDVSDAYSDREGWRAKVLNGLDQMRFTGLDVEQEAAVEDPDRLSAVREAAGDVGGGEVEAAHRILFAAQLTVPNPGKKNAFGGRAKADTATVRELSSFVRQGGAWYYTGGELNPASGAWEKGC